MKRRMVVGLIGTAILTALWARWPTSSLPDNVRVDRVVVRKAGHILELRHGAELIKSYRVALGTEPVGPKRWLGDGRTPEGNYVIDYHKPNSSFHRALHISYPSAEDSAAARSMGVEPGGLIMVHGMKNGRGYVGRLHAFVDWTDWVCCGH